MIEIFSSLSKWNVYAMHESEDLNIAANWQIDVKRIQTLFDMMTRIFSCIGLDLLGYDNWSSIDRFVLSSFLSLSQTRNSFSLKITSARIRWKMIRVSFGSPKSAWIKKKWRKEYGICDGDCGVGGGGDDDDDGGSRFDVNRILCMSFWLFEFN